MTDDLIERLRREAAAWDDWNEDHPDDAAVTTPPLLREAAAALEAAREDAERWRHARRILTVEDIEKSQAMFNAFGFEGDEHENRKADAAIDQARGKGGCGEGVKNANG